MLGDRELPAFLPPEVRLQTMKLERGIVVVDGEEENRESLARVLAEPDLADVWVAFAHELGQLDIVHGGLTSPARTCALKDAGHVAFQMLGQEAEHRRLVAALKRHIALLNDLARRLDFRGRERHAKPAPRLAEHTLLAAGDE
jgi:hypothetical protein